MTQIGDPKFRLTVSKKGPKVTPRTDSQKGPKVTPRKKCDAGLKLLVIPGSYRDLVRASSDSKGTSAPTHPSNLSFFPQTRIPLDRCLYCQNPGFGPPRFGALKNFHTFANFYIIFLLSRYTDSDHF